MGHIDELKRLFENRIAMRETKFFGRTCMGRIEDGLMGKIEFHNNSGRAFFPHLKVSVFERTNGMVDQMIFLMMDVIGEKQKNGSAIIPAFIQKENWSGILRLQKRTAKNWWMQSMNIWRCSRVWRKGRPRSRTAMRFRIMSFPDIGETTIQSYCL